MTRVFPDRPVVEIGDEDPIFHTVYDLDERYQVPGAVVATRRGVQLSTVRRLTGPLDGASTTITAA